MNYTSLDPQIKQDVFIYKTTYLNDFKHYPYEEPEVKVWHRDREEKPVKPCQPYIFTDHETYLPWKKGVHIPFNLLWDPKPITQTSPYTQQTVPVSMNELDNHEEVIKTRPRLYMSPAVSIDDIENPETRKLLCDNMYTSEWRKASQKSCLLASIKPQPTTTLQKYQGDPVAMQIDILKPLPPNWSVKGEKWEKNQLKSCVDNTRMFWVNKDPPVKCGACERPTEGLVPQQTKDEISELIKQDRLRLAHDLSVPGYTGYKQRYAKTVSLAKVDLPVTHPFVSVSQAITKRYAQDLSK